MKHWHVRTENKIDVGRVVSIKKLDNGNVRFREECDCYFEFTLTKEEAKQLLTEALEWLDHE